MSEQFSDVDHVFKIILLGDTSVGKTQVLMKFTRNQFIEGSQTTVGVEFSAKTVEAKGKKVKLQVWDTAGQEKFKAITKAYYRGAVGALIIYDVTERSSFESAQRWLEQIRECAEQPNILIMLIGNKCDKENRQVQKQEAIQYAQANKMGFLETSAKTGHNIEFTFKQLSEELISDIQNQKEEQHKMTRNASVLKGDNNQKKKKKDDGCC